MFGFIFVCFFSIEGFTSVIMDSRLFVARNRVVIRIFGGKNECRYCYVIFSFFMFCIDFVIMILDVRSV